ncbi:undecaprenyl-diphosphate phosphatase [Egicoccus sp. AB-alg2]|uniref:undecaprenyl-diphosphate phosphatase n=1 Tax=Egicoccus sp. AB-alg2 TaxID=3242693 RepID=UPI00359DCCA2
MSLFVAFVLGVVQGVFMFFPVSSTSHLVLTQTWLRGVGVDLPPPESAEMVLFDLLVHVGTLVSIAVVMGAGLRALASGVVDDLGSGRLRAGGLREAVSTRLVLLGLLTTAVTGVLGLVFVDPLTRVFGSPTAIAVALVGTGAMLWWTDRAGPGRLRARDVGVGVAVAIGIAQFAALAPGLSRSGTTIFAALLVGMHRKLAARYSFYVAIPTILAAAGLQALEVLGAGGLTQVSWAAMAVGTVTAAVVGAGALWAVLRLLEQARFRIFSVYVWVLAAIVLTTGFGA